MPEYHQILFKYIVETSKIDFLVERNKLTSDIVASHVSEYSKQGEGSENGERFLLSLHKKLEAKMAEIISQKSVYYWMYLYRRIGVFESFGEDGRILQNYREIMEVAFKKYGMYEIGDELIQFSNDGSDGNIDLIANGLYKKALNHYGIPGNKIRFCGIFLKNFKEKDLLNIYILERLAYEYYEVAVCLRRLFKGGHLVINDLGNTNTLYTVHATDELESLMYSFDVRSQKYAEVTTSNGVILNAKFHSNMLMYLPHYNYTHLSFEQCPQYALFDIPFYPDDRFSKFIPNFVWYPFDFSYYYHSYEYLSEEFENKFSYSFKSFVCTMYMLVQYNFIMSKSSVTDAYAALKRGYKHWINKEALESTLYNAYCYIKDRIEISLTREEMSTILNELFLPEDRSIMSLTTLGPQYPIISCGQEIVIDFHAITNTMLTKMHYINEDPDKNYEDKGHAFESIVIERLKKKGFKLWKCQQKLVHFDGTSKEIDVSFVFDGCLFIAELKCNTIALNHACGTISFLNHRKDKVQTAISQSDDKASWLKDHLSGSNYALPDNIHRIVPFAVSPFVEYIWEKGDNLWLTDAIPRICTPSECELLCDENILAEISKKPYVVNINP